MFGHARRFYHRDPLFESTGSVNGLKFKSIELIRIRAALHTCQRRACVPERGLAASVQYSGQVWKRIVFHDSKVGMHGGGKLGRLPAGWQPSASRMETTGCSQWGAVSCGASLETLPAWLDSVWPAIAKFSQICGGSTFVDRVRTVIAVTCRSFVTVFPVRCPRFG